MEISFHVAAAKLWNDARLQLKSVKKLTVTRVNWRLSYSSWTYNIEDAFYVFYVSSKTHLFTLTLD